MLLHPCLYKDSVCAHLFSSASFWARWPAFSLFSRSRIWSIVTSSLCSPITHTHSHPSRPCSHTTRLPPAEKRKEKIVYKMMHEQDLSNRHIILMLPHHPHPLAPIPRRNSIQMMHEHASVRTVRMR